MVHGWALYLLWRLGQCTRVLKVSILETSRTWYNIAVSQGATHSDNHISRLCHGSVVKYQPLFYYFTGLSLFVGLIIYIGSITEVATVANRSKSGPDAVFLYSYGTSLVLTVIAFFGAELTGVLAVHLCLSVIRRNRLKHIERKSTVQTVTSGNGFDQTETKSAHACAHARTHARDAAWTDVPVGTGDGGSPSSSEIIYAEVVPSELTVAPVHIVRQGSWKSLFYQASVYSESCGNGKIHSEKQRSCLSIDGILHSQALRRITPV